MQLPKISFIVLDTETTGLTPKVNRIIEFASMKIEDGKVTGAFEQLFSIGNTEIPDEVQALTRIRPNQLRNQPTFEDTKKDILNHIGEDTVIVGQNIGFDIDMLKSEGIDLSERPCLDTAMLASLVFPELDSYSLGYMSAVLKLNHAPKHRALGDVRATLELFERCWIRLLELPAQKQEEFCSIFGKSSSGYQLLASSLPKSKIEKDPTWIKSSNATEPNKSDNSETIKLEVPSKGTVEIIEEPPTPGIIQKIINGTSNDDSKTHWIAVKNLEATIKRICISDKVRIFYPPFLLLKEESKTQLINQELFSADEATVALKLLWLNPKHQGEISMHGGEVAIWNGKLCCTDDDKEYTEQFENIPKVILLDHKQLLSFLADPSHTAHGALEEGAHIIIDDASMLEDTATKAYGWYCSIKTLRAAAETHPGLASFTDLLTIWIERTRDTQDIRYLTPSDLNTPDTNGLRDQIQNLLDDESLPTSVKRHLSHAYEILDSNHLRGRIVYTELQYTGSLALQSVPESIGLFLYKYLYSTYNVSLLMPPNGNIYKEILPGNVNTTIRSDLWESHSPSFSTLFPEDISIDDLISDPPEGKTIVLATSKRSIASIYVKYSEAMEERGMTLLCQGLDGGVNRTKAGFLAADGPVIWVITPWAYEGVHLPAGTVTTLCLTGMPFDHPSHAVLSQRAAHYQDPFTDYSLPRMEHRLFRLLRNFSSQCSKDATVLILDKRIATKKYGRKVAEYIKSFSQDFTEEGQMSLL